MENDMRNIDAKVIEDTVARLCIEANLRLPPDVINAIERAEKAEPWDGAKRILSLLGDNVRIASEKTLPVCQDTGMACVFVELGQDVHTLRAILNRPSITACAAVTVRAICAKASYVIRCAG